MLGIGNSTLDQSLQEYYEGSPHDRDLMLSDEERRIHGDPAIEQHLVEYARECVKESFESTKERRELDEALWRAHTWSWWWVTAPFWGCFFLAFVVLFWEEMEQEAGRPRR